MATTVIVEPQDLMPAYNPVYIYATSSNTGEENFRYVVDVSSLSVPIAPIGQFRVRPRYGDDFLEINIQKILQSRLEDFTNDIDINQGVYGFNNTGSSIIRYRLEIKEEYLLKLTPSSFIDSSGFLRIRFTDSAGVAPFLAGDFIRMENAAKRLNYTSITENTGNTRFNFGSAHGLTNGMEVLIRQNSPTQYNQYNGITTILSNNANDITVNVPYQGVSFIPQTGQVILNNRYDGVHFVTGVSNDGTFTYVTTNTVYGENDTSTLTTSRVYYADERSSISYNQHNKLYDSYNGSLRFDEFMGWDQSIYNPTSTSAKFLTTLPNPFTVRPDNDMFLNFWSRTLSGAMGFLEIKTFDTSDAQLATYSIPNDVLLGNQRRMMNVSVGPRSIENSCYPVELITGGNFGATGSWNIFNIDNGEGTISGGNFNFEDLVEFGGTASVLLTQTNVLPIGTEVTVTFTITNNLETSVFVGDSGGTVEVVSPDETGVFTHTFTPTTTDLWILFVGLGATTHGLIMSQISVTKQICPDVSCPSVSYYTVQLKKTNNTPQSEVRTFVLDCSCDRYDNYPLLFLDRLGSFVSLNFELKTKQELGIERKDFKKVVGDRVGSDYKYSLTERSRKIYDVTIKEDWTLNSDWVDESLGNYYEELFTSPNVQILKDGVYQSVIVKDTTYERKSLETDGLIMYSIKIEFTNQNSVQV